MELRHLRAFVAVADERNLTKAAERLNICQPPLSRQIHQLEHEIGVRLFVRKHDGVQLTSAGLALLSKARTIIGSAADFVNSASRLGGVETGQVRVGFAWGLWEVVNQVRQRCSDRHPDVAVEAGHFTSQRQNEALTSRRIDVAFLRSPVTSADLQSMPLFEEVFVVLLAESHRLARSKSLRIKDIEREPLLLYARDGRSGVYDKTLALYAKAGVVPTVIETPHSVADQAATIPVACGKGVFLALSSPLTLSHRVGGVAAVPLHEPDARILVSAAWRRGESSPSVMAFVDSVRDVFSTRRPPGRSAARC
jgi:LysR family transcriptional regulator, benzoate and cis,cis-muconate-responsive activator of ben and cat genes